MKAVAHSVADVPHPHFTEDVEDVREVIHMGDRQVDSIYRVSDVVR